ncbi:ABC transporter ATP-binding protein [Pseudogemmobacter bohemicus]|uniref:ABC transporter ATP-binding protein n=1 Tax=Pseudogemmobacter bohemicus TaxID=2250708 RepID=UPI000DD4A195|nr:ATP-binding cassette domain-containing protein [Pseudogemmobacter bohemicus]
MTLVLDGPAQIGGQPLFPPLRLTLREGEWLTLLGPSGVGKTTLLRLIGGLPVGAEFTGRITGRRPVALMAQDPGLMPWATVAANITLGSKLRGEAPDRVRLAEVLERTGLAPHAARRPGQLSGGQRQRVALARVLMEDRPLVLLDEPFSALDVGLRLKMQDLAAELLRGRTVMMISHDPGEAARLSDRICLMSPAGLEDIAAPAGPGPRAPDAPEVLACAHVLLTRLVALA